MVKSKDNRVLAHFANSPTLCYNLLSPTIGLLKTATGRLQTVNRGM